MLNSNDFQYEPYKDTRVINRPGFTVGRSGPLLLATSKTTGKKYIVKHTYPHNAANEYVACWLANKLGAPCAAAFLLSENGAFNSPYAVAIEFIDGLFGFVKDKVPEVLQEDLIKHFALCLVLHLDDMIQLGRTEDHIFSYDFSEAFGMVGMDYILNEPDEDRRTDLIIPILNEYRRLIQRETFDVPGLAAEFHLDRDQLKRGMASTIKNTLMISDDDITAMSDELMEMYPVSVAVFYEECIRSIQKRAQQLFQT